MWKTFKEAIKVPWSAFLLAGFLLSLASAVIYFNGKAGQIGLGNAKFLISAAGVCFIASLMVYYIPPRRLKDFGPAPTGKITSPRQGDQCGDSWNFVGTISGKLRGGWEFWLIRRFEDQSPLYPEAKVIFVPGETGKDRNWSADAVNVGGAVGNERHFELWMVSPDVDALFTHIRAALTSHWDQARAAGEHNIKFGLQQQDMFKFRPLPGFGGKLQDMVELARVRVYRK